MANQEREMKPVVLLNTLNASTAAFWNARNQRERSIMMTGSLALLLFLLYAIFIGPALNGREKLSKDLPALRQQAAELQALSKQAAELNAGGAVAAAPISQESIAESLSSRGMKPQNLAVTDDMVRVQLNPVSFSGLLDWITDQQKTTHLTVVDANFIALPQTDMVNATVTLRQQRNEG
jgi:general secretion pathway protein M